MRPKNGTVAPLRLLLLEDQSSDAELLISALRRSGLQAEVKVVGTRAAYLKSLDPAFDAIISDFDLPQFNAKEALALLQAQRLDIPFIVVSGMMGEDTAVDLMRLGAADYLLKDRMARLPQALAHAVGAAKLRQERKVNETALRDSEARMRSTIDSAFDCIVTIDQESVILDFNPAAEKTFGYKREAVAGRILTDTIIPPQLREAHKRGMRRFLQTGESKVLGRHLEVTGMRADGSEFPLELTVSRLGTQEPALFTAFMRDITEQTVAREKLRHQEEQYRQLFEKNPIPTWVYDPETLGYLAANDAAIRHYGYSREEFLKMTLKDIRPPEDVPRLLAMLASDGSVGFGVWRHRKKDGTLINVQVTVQPIRFHGLPAGLILAEDITERERIERELREAAEKIEAIINSVEGIVWEADARTLQFSFVSENAEAILGYPRKSWLEERDFWKSHVHPEDLARTLALCKEAAEALREHVVEYRMLAADGREVWLRDSIRVISDGGRPVTLRGIMTDVTKAKRTAERLRIGEAQIREQAKLLDLAHDAIMVRDMDDRVLYWNHGAEALYGWNEAEVLGKEASSFLYKREPAAFAAARAVLLEEGNWTGEVKHIRKDGGTIMLCSRWTLVRDESAAPKSILIINTDITDQKKIEEQFLRAQRLEGIGTLASGVAHDLNNILAPILMGTAVLRRTEMPAADEAILSLIETCAQRGADIVKQVLTFARGAEGERLLLQPAHLVQDMAKVARGTFPKAITIRTNLAESLWPIEGDPTLLHQVLLNLSVNARDAMPAGGTLTMSVDNFAVDEHYASMTPGAKAGPHVLFEVNDTGMGIARPILDKIFDPFFTTKELGRGTGLGLSTVTGIVKSHGGFISVQSEIGRGTTFSIYLPATIGGTGTLEERQTVTLPPANGELLLIVDDESAILHVAKALLEGHGYQVLTAEGATEALALFAMRKDEIKMVLTDLAMPLMDGIALIRTLQKMRPEVRVIASTGRGEQEQHLHALADLNVCACLSKPYNKETLLMTLHDALNPQTS